MDSHTCFSYYESLLDSPGTVLTWATVRCMLFFFFSPLSSPHPPFFLSFCFFFLFKCIPTQELAQGFSMLWYKKYQQNHKHQYFNIKVSKETLLKNWSVISQQSNVSSAYPDLVTESYLQTHTGREEFSPGLRQDSEGIWLSFLPAHLAACAGTQSHKLWLTRVGPPYGAGTSALLQLPCSLPRIPEL